MLIMEGKFGSKLNGVVLTVSTTCKAVRVGVGTFGVRPFTAASHRI